MFEHAELLLFATDGLHSNGYRFMWGAYFCMGAYKHDVVADNLL